VKFPFARLNVTSMASVGMANVPVGMGGRAPIVSIQSALTFSFLAGLGNQSALAGALMAVVLVHLPALVCQDISDSIVIITLVFPVFVPVVSTAVGGGGLGCNGGAQMAALFGTMLTVGVRDTTH